MDPEYSNEARYNRQVILPEIGKSGQDTLRNARILCVGAGGLGCPALIYLAAAGVGNIGIIDYDLIDISNLHRQVLFSEYDIGKPKAETAADKLSLMFPGLNVSAHNYKLDSNNAFELISQYDVIIDGSDNFPSRYLINDACVLSETPWVFGSVLRFEGQLAVFNVQTADGTLSATYRCAFPEPPSPGFADNCSESGVLGAVTGIIGTMMALECIKLITGAGEPCYNRLVFVSGLELNFTDWKLLRNENVWKDFPGNEKELSMMNYDSFCGEVHHDTNISRDVFKKILQSGRNDFVILNVAESWEQPLVQLPNSINIPLHDLPESIHRIPASNDVIVVCTSGQRSSIACRYLQEKGQLKSVASLAGGLSGVFE